MTFPFKMVPVLVTFVHFRGCLLFSKVLYTFYNSPMFCSLLRDILKEQLTSSATSFKEHNITWNWNVAKIKFNQSSRNSLILMFLFKKIISTRTCAPLFPIPLVKLHKLHKIHPETKPSTNKIHAGLASTLDAGHSSFRLYASWIGRGKGPTTIFTSGTEYHRLIHGSSC